MIVVVRTHVHGIAFGLTLSVLALPALAINQLVISADEVVTPAFKAGKISGLIHLGNPTASLKVAVADVKRGETSWRDSTITCASFSYSAGGVACASGSVKAAGRETPMTFSASERMVEVSLRPQAHEAWQVKAKRGGEAWAVEFSVTQGDATRLVPLIPVNQPLPTKGVVNGTIRLVFGAHGIASIEPDLALTDFAFADKEGLRAGEKIAVSLHGRIDPRGAGWRWNADVAWKAGEIFWQPLYFASAGNHLAVAGSSDDTALRVESGTLQLGSTGTLELAGVLNLKTKAVPEFTLRGTGLDLASLYPLLLKPFLAQSVAGQIDAAGRIDVDWRRRGGVTQIFNLGLHDVNLADGNKRFSVKGVNAHIPWVKEQPSDGVIEIASAELLQLPIGPVVARPRMNGLAVTLPEVSIPLLDGQLKLEDVHAVQTGEDWTWTLKGGLAPLSLPALTEALHLPRMAGTLSGVIPQVSYAKDQIRVDGALLLRIFDGSIVVKDLTLSAPLGLVPRAHAYLSMRNLDLDLLTQTFSF